MKNRSIYIVGQGPGFELCPLDKETWSLNMSIVRLSRIDKLFMTDPIERRSAVRDGFYTLKTDQGWEKVPCTVDTVKDAIRASGCEFISSFAYPDIPLYKPYPIREIVHTFGTDYFVNTICYMIAYAIHSGVTSIDFYGVNQATGSEYMYHKPCVEFWIGLALGQGVGITIHGDQSELLRNYKGLMYGYRMKYEDLKQHLNTVGELSINK